MMAMMPIRGIPQHQQVDDAQHHRCTDLGIKDGHQAVITDHAADEVADAGAHRLQHGKHGQVLAAVFRIADADEVGEGIDSQRTVEQTADDPGKQQHGHAPGNGEEELPQGIAEEAHCHQLGVGFAIAHLAPEGAGEEGTEAHHRKGHTIDVGRRLDHLQEGRRNGVYKVGDDGEAEVDQEELEDRSVFHGKSTFFL